MAKSSSGAEASAFQRPEYTRSLLPEPSSFFNSEIIIIEPDGSRAIWYSDGTQWLSGGGTGASNFDQLTGDPLDNPALAPYLAADSGYTFGGNTLNAANIYHHTKMRIFGGDVGAVTMAADLATNGRVLVLVRATTLVGDVPTEEPHFTVAFAAGVTVIQPPGTTLSSAESADGSVSWMCQSDGVVRVLSAQAAGYLQVARTARQGLQPYSPFADALIPIGTAAINTSATAAGTAVAALDTSVLFRGRPTTRIDITGSPSGNTLETGISAATFTLSVSAQQILTRGITVAIKGAQVTGSPKHVPTVYALIGGNAGYTSYYALTLTNYVDTTDGWRVFHASALTAGVVSTVGTPNLAAATRCKLQLVMSGGIWAAGSVWVGCVSAAPVPKTSVVLTVDDGDEEVYTYLYPALRARGLKAAFSIDTGIMNTAGFVTSAQVTEMARSGVVEITNHGANNEAYSTVGLAPYLANLASCDAALAALGVPESSRKLHAYVQGSNDATLIAAMRSLGYRSMREVGTPGRITRPLLTNLAAGTDTGQHSRYTLPATSNLESGTSVASIIALIEAAKLFGGTVFLMGHRFLATAGAITYVAGYDATHGMENLLDYLALEKEAGRIDVPRWSEWLSAVDSGLPA